MQCRTAGFVFWSWEETHSHIITYRSKTDSKGLKVLPKEATRRIIYSQEEIITSWYLIFFWSCSLQSAAEVNVLLKLDLVALPKLNQTSDMIIKLGWQVRIILVFSWHMMPFLDLLQHLFAFQAKDRPKLV